MIGSLLPILVLGRVTDLKILYRVVGFISASVWLVIGFFVYPCRNQVETAK